MANKIYKNKKILYVCFEVNRKNIFNLSFCLVIVNAPKNNQRFHEIHSWQVHANIFKVMRYSLLRDFHPVSLFFVAL